MSCKGWHTWAMLATVVAALGALRPASADDGCPTGCCRERCPPYYIHHYEGPPRISFKHACPKPICAPCELPHWGYFEPCWRPWPFPPDWSHCPVPPAAAMIPSAVIPRTSEPPVPGPGTGGYRELPAPKRIGPG